MKPVRIQRQPAPTVETDKPNLPVEGFSEEKQPTDYAELWDWCATEVFRLDNGEEVWKKINEAHRQALGGENE